MKGNFRSITVLIAIFVALAACSQSTKQVNNKAKESELQQQKPIPFGHVQLQFRVEEIAADSSSIMIIVEKTEGYGANTSRVGVGDTLNISVSANSTPKIFNSGTQFSGLFKQQKSQGINRTVKPAWILVKLY